MGALLHPFDSHRIVFAVDLDAPSHSIAHWPEDPAFTAGWPGWAWYEDPEDPFAEPMDDRSRRELRKLAQEARRVAPEMDEILPKRRLGS